MKIFTKLNNAKNLLNFVNFEVDLYLFFGFYTIGKNIFRQGDFLEKVYFFSSHTREPPPLLRWGPDFFQSFTCSCRASKIR